MDSINHYKLELNVGKNKVFIEVQGADSAHAQAQASDIARAMKTHNYTLTYADSTKKHEELSTLFKNLASNNFSYTDCNFWEGKTANKYPCIYVCGRRFYVRNVIADYLDVRSGDHTIKQKCKNKLCINPYHFEYNYGKNSKLTAGDARLIGAYRQQGASARQIAELFQVHPCTIYRVLT